MKNIVTASAVGRRHACANFLSQMNRGERVGVVTDVKLTKIGWLLYHIEFKFEAES